MIAKYLLSPLGYSYARDLQVDESNDQSTLLRGAPAAIVRYRNLDVSNLSPRESRNELAVVSSGHLRT